MAISDRTLSEDNLLDSLVLIVEQYELIHYPMDDALPHDVLSHLMESNKLKPKSLIVILGSKRRVSAVLNGKKEITKNQARKLGTFFKVTPSLFICAK